MVSALLICCVSYLPRSTEDRDLVKAVFFGAREAEVKASMVNIWLFEFDWIRWNLWYSVHDFELEICDNGSRYWLPVFEAVVR